MNSATGKTKSTHKYTTRLQNEASSPLTVNGIARELTQDIKHNQTDYVVWCSAKFKKNK